MWTREIDKRIAKLIADLETGSGLGFETCLGWMRVNQGAVRTIDVSHSKAEETSGIIQHSPVGQVLVRLLPSGSLNITEKPIPGHNADR
jgi:hypothetical protein